MSSFRSLSRTTKTLPPPGLPIRRWSSDAGDGRGCRGGTSAACPPRRARQRRSAAVGSWPPAPSSNAPTTRRLGVAAPSPTPRPTYRDGRTAHRPVPRTAPREQNRYCERSFSSNLSPLSTGAPQPSPELPRAREPWFPCSRRCGSGHSPVGGSQNVLLATGRRPRGPSVASARRGRSPPPGG